MLRPFFSNSIPACSGGRSGNRLCSDRYSPPYTRGHGGNAFRLLAFFGKCLQPFFSAVASHLRLPQSVVGKSRIAAYLPMQPWLVGGRWGSASCWSFLQWGRRLGGHFRPALRAPCAQDLRNDARGKGDPYGGVLAQEQRVARISIGARDETFGHGPICRSPRRSACRSKANTYRFFLPALAPSLAKSWGRARLCSWHGGGALPLHGTLGIASRRDRPAFRRYTDGLVCRLAADWISFGPSAWGVVA